MGQVSVTTQYIFIDSLPQGRCIKISEKNIFDNDFCQYILHIFNDITFEWMEVILSQ